MHGRQGTRSSSSRPLDDPRLCFSRDADRTSGEQLAGGVTPRVSSEGRRAGSLKATPSLRESVVNYFSCNSPSVSATCVSSGRTKRRRIESLARSASAQIDSPLLGVCSGQITFKARTRNRQMPISLERALRLLTVYSWRTGRYEDRSG